MSSSPLPLSLRLRKVQRQDTVNFEMYDIQQLSRLKLARSRARFVCLVTHWTRYKLGTTPLKPLRCRAYSWHTMNTVAQSYQSWTSTTPHSKNSARSRVGTTKRVNNWENQPFMWMVGKSSQLVTLSFLIRPESKYFNVFSLFFFIVLSQQINFS